MIHNPIDLQKTQNSVVLLYFTSPGVCSGIFIQEYYPHFISIQLSSKSGHHTLSLQDKKAVVYFAPHFGGFVHVHEVGHC